VGIPTLVADLITPEDGVILHTENGMLGVGPSPEEGGALDYSVNAGKIPVTALPGSSYFDSSASFAMIRGGHVDVAIMGALQVDEKADLANWAVPGKPLLGVGGAMDLASAAKRLLITMTHTARGGASKIVPECTLPLTVLGAVDMVVTELAVFTFEDNQLTCRAHARGNSSGGPRQNGGGIYRTIGFLMPTGATSLPGRLCRRSLSSKNSRWDCHSSQWNRSR
jgi:3-oxoacid CoA-transferase